MSKFILKWFLIGCVVFACGLVLFSIPGCVTYSKVDNKECKAVARGYYFTFQTPGVIEECRSQEDR